MTTLFSRDQVSCLFIHTVLNTREIKILKKKTKSYMLTGVSLQTRMDIHGKVCIQRLTGSMVNLNREWSGFGFNNSKNDNDNYNALLILIHIRKSRIFIIYIPSLNLLRYISWVESVQMKYRILSPGCNEDTVLED